MVLLANASVPDATAHREVIEHTFDVFCGQCATMDVAGFVKFCASSKRVSEADANIIFFAVVRNVNQGMNFSEFKDALSLLLNVGKDRTDSRTLSERSSKGCSDRKRLVEKSCTAKGSAKQNSGRKMTATENHSPNAAGIRKKSSTILCWSPPSVD